MKIYLYITFGIITIIGWNVFLVIRDNKMFDAYYGKTRHQQYCEQLNTWHPDCKVE